jgi:hypothetical protein
VQHSTTWRAGLAWRETALACAAIYRPWQVNSLQGERAAEQPLILPVSRQARRISSGKQARSRTVSDDFADLLDAVSHHRADHDGVGIHCATLGQGPLLVMIHGQGQQRAIVMAHDRGGMIVWNRALGAGRGLAARQPCHA